MKTKPTLCILFALLSLSALVGCQTPKDEFKDDQEFSNMPWNTPQSWEGSRSLPGMGY